MKPQEKKRLRTNEDLSLLLEYLSLIGIWFALPSVGFLLGNDRRFFISFAFLFAAIIVLIYCYITLEPSVFPPPAYYKNI